MFYRNGGKAIALTLAVVITALGAVFFIVIALELTNRFTVDRLLGIIGATGGFMTIVGMVVRLLRNWLRNAE